MTQTMRVALYARSAVVSQEQIDEQIAALRDYCQEQDWAIADTFQDAGKAQPSLNSMLEAANAEPRPFDAIVMRDTGRISRNVGEVAAFRQQLQDRDIKLLLLDTPRP